ncbi:myosin light chain kinase 2, skeletal/cardiac muscle isoform X2 [Ambystoma mexicanum]
MSQEVRNTAAAAPTEEKPAMDARDETSGDAQNTQEQHTAERVVSPSTEEVKQKSSPEIPGKEEVKGTTEAIVKDTCTESKNMVASNKDEMLKVVATEDGHKDTAFPTGTSTGDGEDASEAQTPKTTEKETKPETVSCSRQLSSGPSGPDVASVARNGQVSPKADSAHNTSSPMKGDHDVEKDGGGNANAPTREKPPLDVSEGHDASHRAKSGKEQGTGHPKSGFRGHGAPAAHRTTELPTLGLNPGGDSAARKAFARTESAPAPSTALTNRDSTTILPIMEGDRVAEFFQVIDDSPPPSAPFPHRFVTLRPGDVTSLFDINIDEILGGGRFGDVHTCTEKSTGLQLVAKVIKIQDSKDKEMALNEVDVMNQLNHLNLILMYDALELPDSIFLFLEYVEGGELFERIIDENYNLTEMDAMVFVRQICNGIFYMHQMYVLHLDLKPENIVCVSQTGHMVKIIDFGLARRYKPREKLRVSFGTPEFIAPEVVNFDYVSFPTDMWSLGVITYMMLSGLSPFLGDNDTETMNNVLSSEVDFNEEPFENVSDEAKDFISNLLVREKSGRLSAGQCLRHPWLNDLAEKAKRCNRLLKSQIELRKYMMRRRWKRNFIAVTAANRFKKISSVTSLATLGM